MRINHRDSTPVFRQISDAIRQDIQTGALSAGEAIPSEREYAGKLGVSRMTVRSAINELAKEGWLLRSRGRNTIVSPVKINKNALGFMSFTEDMQSRGMQASSKVLRSDEEVADAAVAAQLGLAAGARVVFIERVRLASGAPMALERVHLPHARFGGIVKRDLARQSLYEVMEREFDSRPTRADETIEAIRLNATDARLLGVAKGSPALLACRVTRDERGEIIEAVKTLYRGDRYRMVFARHRQS